MSLSCQAIGLHFALFKWHVQWALSDTSCYQHSVTVKQCFHINLPGLSRSCVAVGKPAFHGFWDATDHRDTKTQVSHYLFWVYVPLPQSLRQCVCCMCVCVCVCSLFTAHFQLLISNDHATKLAPYFCELSPHSTIGTHTGMKWAVWEVNLCQSPRRMIITYSNDLL